MAFPVVLTFDPITEAKLKALSASLSALYGNTVPKTTPVRPHLTLGGWEALDLVTAADALATFATSTVPLTVALSAVGTFPTDQGVVYISPLVTFELLDLHRGFHAGFAHLGSDPHPLYLPPAWVPHCTVAINLPEDTVADAIAACRKSDVFGPATLAQIALLEYPPGAEICVFELGGKDPA